MKAILCIIVLLACAVTIGISLSPAMAQVHPDSYSCPQCVRVATTTCTENYDCWSVMPPDYVDFTPTCDGSFTLSIQLVCPNGSYCANCLGCAKLYQGVTLLRDVTTVCGTDGCGKCSSAPSCPTYTLSHTTVYRLYVGKLPCPDGHCDNCNAQCRAVAYLYNAGSSCQNP
jgi:hypothetical protein